MTLRDEIPIHRCAVRGCPVVGRWPEGQCCPLHRESIWKGSRTPTKDTEIEVTDAPQD